MADSSRRDAWAARVRELESWRSKLRVLWSETGGSLQKAWIALWAVGVILLGLGAWGDSIAYWEHKPYLTNLFSALTGAAFGIPLALIVLQRVTAREADAAEARAAHRLAERVSASLAEGAKAPVGGGIREVQTAKDYLIGQRDMLSHAEPPYNPFDKVRPSDFQLGSYIDALERLSAYVSEFLRPTTTRDLAEVSVQWSILNREARSRLLETGGEWLSGTRVTELNRLVATVTDFNRESWLRKSYDLQDEFRKLLNLNDPNGSISYSKIRDAVDEFESWLEEILSFVDALTHLIAESGIAKRILASRQ